VEGTSVHDYATSAIRWAEHTDTGEFLSAFLTVVRDASLSNAARSDAVEAFLLGRAVDLGVVRKSEISKAHNPNKWGKILAPWFDDSCREAKRMLI
jgi:hypothetical protein